MENRRLVDFFPDWADGKGIFTALDDYDVPWADPDNPFLPLLLDHEYFGNRSGNKIGSPLVRKVGETSLNSPALSDYQRTRLAHQAYIIYGLNWNKQYATLSAEYNPINNYDMIETMTDDETVIEYGRDHTRTDNLSHSKTGTETVVLDDEETRTDNLSHSKTGTETVVLDDEETRTDNLANTASKSVYGFNDSAASPSETESGSNTGTQKTERDNTDTTTFNTTDADTGTQKMVRDNTDTTTYNTTDSNTGTQRDVDSGSDTHTRNYTLERSGNIGVTTSQQMLQSERDLWMWNFFRDVVFPDLDRVLTCPIY